MNEHKLFKTPAIPLVLMTAGLNQVFGNVILAAFVGVCIYITAILVEQI